MGTALPNIPELSNDKLIQAATAPGVTTMRIRHIFFAITFVISAGHALTLGDVLMGLRAELSRRESTCTPCHALYSPPSFQLIHEARLDYKCFKAESTSVVLCRMTPPPTSGFSQRTKVVVQTLILHITTTVIFLCFRRLKTVTALLPRTKSDTNIEHFNAPLLNNGWSCYILQDSSPRFDSFPVCATPPSNPLSGKSFSTSTTPLKHLVSLRDSAALHYYISHPSTLLLPLLAILFYCSL